MAAPKKSKKSSDTELVKEPEIMLFSIIDALNNKDYGFYERLSPTQQKKVSLYMMLQWMSNNVSFNPMMQSYYIQSADCNANRHFFNENVSKHPNLQWLMLCTISPGMGKQYHKWLPSIKDKVVKLKESPKPADIHEYFKKLYPNKNFTELADMSDEYIAKHKKMMYIANTYPEMNLEDVEFLSGLVTDEDIRQHEQDSGNPTGY